MQLDEFLEQKVKGICVNSHIQHKNFETLYLRKGKVCFHLSAGSFFFDNVITIASITSKKPKTGSFTKLVNYLLKKNYIVFVECVLSPSFGISLEKMGFKRVNHDSGLHYIKGLENKGF